jgi:1-aminocyclopropane-1-carboxylate deaminase/D-cysteine desulfhydrase-like pyridoxal-dependent ACC family enzyme
MAENLPDLFLQYPKLKSIPWVSLGRFPTPVEPMAKLGERLGFQRLWVKRDDLSGPRYGGNKVRKLEFLLADAQAQGRDTVLTLGAAGSNHCLATAVYAKELGLKSIAVFVPQPVQEYVRQNLLSDFNLGLDMHYLENPLRVPDKIIRLRLSHKSPRTGARPYFIWAGGSSPTGTLGYINAGLEIARQVSEGLLPEPDFVFTPVGSCGTFAGLILGLRLGALRTRAVGVRVYDRAGANPYLVSYLTRACVRLLRRYDPSFPEVRIRRNDFTFLDEFFGKGYAHFTRAGIEAVTQAREFEGIKLDGTYSGKAFAGLIAFAHRQGLQDKTLLFVNTYNSRELTSLMGADRDYKCLPLSLQPYFELPLAPVED